MNPSAVTGLSLGSLLTGRHDSVPLPTAEKASLGAWNPQGPPDPLPSPFLLYLFTQVHLASPARRQGLSLGWTFIVVHSSAGLTLPPKALPTLD